MTQPQDADLVLVPRVKHRKGGTYAVIGAAKIQTDTPLSDYADVVVYQSEATGEKGERA